jgi:ABC-type ATPase involved in cell division
VPDLAVEALAAGCDASELGVLATLSRPTRIQVEDELPALLARLDAQRPSRRRAVEIVVDDYAMQVADGVIEASAGAHKLWRLANGFYEDRRVFSQVAIFVGLASEWDDHPDARAAIETQIVAEARAFVESGGIDLDTA